MIWLILLPWIALTAHTAVNAALLRRLAREEPTEVTERVAVLLPLRNEADRVTPCLEALLAQRNVPHLTIHVLDDNSTDGTAELVRSLAGDKVDLITGAPLPHGWLGKPHACHQLAEAAGDADVVSFVDADVILGPDALARATTMLRATGVTLLSPYPKITGTGRLLQPLLQWSWITFLPLRLMERSPRPSLAAAGGQWLVADRAGYARSGGHAAVRTEILEDIALARQIKRTGGRIALADASQQATCRMYTSWRGLTAGYTKSLWASFGSGPAAAFVVVLLLFLYVLPPAATPILAVTGFWGASLVALGAYGLAVTGRVITAHATGARAWPDALAHPVSVILFAWLTARSFALRRRGALTWRGRSV
ncbi:glycosyltransferase [Actinoplanes sp. CA-142083]|uniref:glycosyltransferase n=1 Tax=Actinoplanes sp. CA-142083 TaxID=3239903 RepID=UPI003D90539D